MKSIDFPIPTSSHDVLTKLERENSQLREQLALRELALDGVSTTFMIVDRTIPDPTIIYCNRMAAEIYGLQREDILGKPLSVFSPFNLSRTPNYQQDSAILASGKKIAYEIEAQRLDGTSFWRGITVAPVFDSTGRLIRSVSIGADITAKREAALRQTALQEQLVAELKERERMQSELHLAQKLESVGRLAAGIAHEINTPIQYIGDCVHFLKTGFADVEQILRGWEESLNSLPPGPERDALSRETETLSAQYELEFLRLEIPKAFERMADGIDRVATIVRSMKEFAHPDSTEQNSANINQALRSTITVAAPVYKYIARVVTDFAELPDVVCHVGELNQVFLNLLVNAAHAIEDSGRDLETGTIGIVTRVEGQSVVIRISDNGCGIPAENLAKLYDPFFTTKEVGRGTGQGLAIAHTIIVDRHGGRLNVSSTVGSGTEFALTLPIEGQRGTL